MNNNLVEAKRNGKFILYKVTENKDILHEKFKSFIKEISKNEIYVDPEIIKETIKNRLNLPYLCNIKIKRN